MNQKTTLSTGIEEYLDTNHEQTVLLNHIGYNQVDQNGSSEKVLSFYILLGSDKQEKLLQAGSVFEFQNSSWKVASVNTAENGNIKPGQAESVTFERVA